MRNLNRSLLRNRIPKVHISEDEEGGKEIELSDDPYDHMRINVENVPVKYIYIFFYYIPVSENHEQASLFLNYWNTNLKSQVSILNQLTKKNVIPGLKKYKQLLFKERIKLAFKTAVSDIRTNIKPVWNVLPCDHG